MVRTANKATKTTSLLTTRAGSSLGFVSLRTGRNSGFTLIEVLIVITIIGIVLSFGLPAVQTITNQRINSTTRKFMGMIKTVRNDAILLNLIHRLAINFDDNTWWIESQRSFRLLEDVANENKPEEEKRKDEVVTSNFEMASKYSKEPSPMPPGVVFSGVLTEIDGLINQGIAYIHFFPNGFTEQSILYLKKDGDDAPMYSMVLRPISGIVDLLPGQVEGF